MSYDSQNCDSATFSMLSVCPQLFIFENYFEIIIKAQTIDWVDIYYLKFVFKRSLFLKSWKSISIMSAQMKFFFFLVLNV